MGTRYSHDGLFRFVFGEPEQMADLLRCILPPELVAAIRWSTLRRLPDTFVDAALGVRRGDLIYVAEIGSAIVLLRVQTEHKSKVDRFTALQQTGYSVRLLEAWRTNDASVRSLPAIVTVVVYHGEEPWDEPVSVHELVDTFGWSDGVRSILAPLQLRQPFLLLDLFAFDEAAFDRMPCTAITGLTLRFLQLLRGLRLDQVVDRMERWGPLVRAALQDPRGQDVLVALLSWCLQRSPENPEVLRALMTKIRDEETPMRSMYDLLLEMNEERGKQQGMQTMLVGVLESRFGELEPDVLARIKSAEAATLQRWSRRVVAAGCLADVFAD
jgi:hypothetical protein